MTIMRLNFRMNLSTAKMFKLLCRNCVFKIKLDLNQNMTIKNAVFALQRYSTPSNNNIAEWSTIKTKFTDKELTQVLKVLNKCDISEMKKVGISDHDIEVLERLPNEKKICQSLEDFLLYDAVTVGQLENICSTIVASKNIKSPQKIATVSPIIKKEILKNLHTAVGLRIGPNHVSWSQLELTGSNCNILKWDYQSISDLKLNVNTTEIIKAGIKIAKNIPHADAFVMERDSSKPMSHINTSMLRLLFRHQQLMSTIITALFTKSDLNGSINDPSKTFYTMRSFASAQLFDLFLGNEAVVANDVVQALLKKKYKGLNNIQSVTIERDIMSYYNTLDILKKEEMNKSLLLTLTFFELAVLK